MHAWETSVDLFNLELFLCEFHVYSYKKLHKLLSGTYIYIITTQPFSVINNNLVHIWCNGLHFDPVSPQHGFRLNSIGGYKSVFLILNWDFRAFCLMFMDHFLVCILCMAVRIIIILQHKRKKSQCKFELIIHCNKVLSRKTFDQYHILACIQSTW